MAIEAIYFDDDDRKCWLDVFAQVCKRHNWVCHAWCQMSNHYHIVVETVEANLSQSMRQLNGVYTQSINRKYQRVGHVFQGRYKAIIVEKESYLLATKGVSIALFSQPKTHIKKCPVVHALS